MIKIVAAKTEAEIRQAHGLFEEYAQSLDFQLCFQNFQAELENLPGDYAPPAGCLLLAYYENNIAGCVAMRQLGEEICELKRMYVRPVYRRRGLGRKLAELIINNARQSGYRKIRLDTIATMTEAIGLYRSLGFEEIDKYRDNPVAGARFFELDLLI
jgi:putative acetyltransferase